MRLFIPAKEVPPVLAVFPGVKFSDPHPCGAKGGAARSIPKTTTLVAPWNARGLS